MTGVRDETSEETAVKPNRKIENLIARCRELAHAQDELRRARERVAMAKAAVSAARLAPRRR